MALPELIEAFEHDTADEVAAILRAAEADARTIDAEAARDRSERIASAAAASAIAHRAQAEADVAAAVHRARADVYAARTAMLERLRTAVEDELESLLDAAVGDALLRVAIACAGDDGGVLRCSSVLVTRARELAPASLVVEEQDALAAGVLVELATGTQIDATLSRLLEREWPRLASEAVRLIAQEAP